MAIQQASFIDYILVAIPLAAAVFLGARGLLPVMRGRFAIVTLAMFAAAMAISLVLSFVSFALLSVMDDAVMAPGAAFGTSSFATTFFVPAAQFVAKSRFVRSLLVAFVQPSLAGVAGIASCLVLLYLRDALVRMGSDITLLFEHFAVFSSSAEKK